jgi:SET domain-containing protein
VAVTATIDPRLACFRLYAGPSPVHRIGVFASETIPANARVIQYAGTWVTQAKRRRLPDDVRSYFFSHDRDWTVDGSRGGSGAEYINHCCEPNLVARPWRGGPHFFSNRRIERGEELTLDYKFPVDAPRVRCRCGAPTCRGTVNRARQVSAQHAQ